MTASIPFDEVADRYDATRGGTRRGRHAAAALLPWMPEGAVVELGVGTGVVAAALADAGRAPVGVDLSLPMLERAAARIPGRVVRGDVRSAPIRRRSAAAVVAVHVLHLVGDLGAAVAEAVSLLRPGGRLLVSGVEGNRVSDDDLAAVDRPLSERHQYPPPAAEAIVSAAAGVGATLVHDGYMDRREFDQTATNAADNLESRAWSWLWKLDDAVWACEVVPVIDALRALPDPDRPRRRWVEWRYLVLEAGAWPTPNRRLSSTHVVDVRRQFRRGRASGRPHR